MKQIICAIAMFACGSRAATITVTNENDSGPGSLRQALVDVMTSPAPRAINFLITPTGATVHAINLATALPALTNTVTVDGTSQPGYSNSPLIKVNGAAITNSGIRGFRLYGGTNLLRGMFLTGFTNASVAAEIAQRGGSELAACQIVSNYAGILINDVGDNIIGGALAASANVIGAHKYIGLEISGDNANNNLVAGNYFGVQPAGAGQFVLGNNVGISIYAGDSNIIRGSASAPQVISGSAVNYGLHLWGDARQNRIEGNYIGTDLAGTGAVANASGIYLNAPDNFIGGADVSNRNVISGNSIAIYVTGAEATGNHIAGNYMCVNAAGTSAVPGSSGVIIQGASSNFITGTAPAPQIIAGSAGVAVSISGPGAEGNVISGNTIGLGATGQVLTNFNGISLYLASGNRIGGPTAGDRNIIAGSQFGAGVNISLSTNNVVEGNLIGLDASDVVRPNLAYGVAIADGNGNRVGGSTPGQRNIISGNLPSGIHLWATASNSIQGNYIGTTIAGTAPLANEAHGIFVEDSSFNWIGGTNREDGNLISGNKTNGILITGTPARGNTIAANFIGTTFTGSSPLSNRNSGIVIRDSANNTVGGTMPGERNVISGNANCGIEFYGGSATGNVVQGNYLGLASNGVSKLGNGYGGGFGAGVYLGSLARGNAIGGAAPGARNVIADNTFGIVGQVAFGNTIQGNYIGLDASGASSASNRVDGIYLEGCDNTLVSGNVISGNGRDGVQLISGSASNVVQANRVGPFATGSGGPGNKGRGILLDSGDANLVGGTSASAQGNVIAFNAGDAVTVVTNGLYTGGSRNSLLGNLIYSNGFGIDLNDDGATTNDPSPDSDTGANGLQNFPILTNAQQGSTFIQGRLASAASKTYRCEFFAVNVPQGMIFLGASNVTTTASGTGTFAVAFVPTVPTGAWVIATATDTNGNTSEFSPAVTNRAALDADGDGMWDAWEVANFGNTTNNGSGNNDGDAFNNYQEFVADTSPTNAGALFMMTSLTNGRPHYPGWNSSAARWYDVEISTGLLPQAWSPLAANLVGIGGFQSYADSADHTTRVYRVRARIP